MSETEVVNLSIIARGIEYLRCSVGNNKYNPCVRVHFLVKLAMRLEKYYWAVSIVSLVTSSLLAVYLSPLPDILKGFVAGVLLSTYVWLFVLIFIESVCNCLKKNSENCTESDYATRYLIKGEKN